MQGIVSTLLLIPIMIWSVFQPILLHNASMTRETIKIALYEISKEASLQGKFDEDMYVKFTESLVENHGYNPACIVISGTETLTNRGQDIEVIVTIPKPMMNVFDAMTINSCERPDSYVPYQITQTIKSEYLP